MCTVEHFLESVCTMPIKIKGNIENYYYLDTKLLHFCYIINYVLHENLLLTDLNKKIPIIFLYFQYVLDDTLSSQSISQSYSLTSPGHDVSYFFNLLNFLPI